MRPALFIQKVRGMGRGVFAGRRYRAGEVIEVCPVIRVEPVAAGGVLEHYVFQWGPNTGRLVLALGYGSLYNHSANANAKFTARLSQNDIIFRALREIAEGEQIFIDYEWDEADYTAFR